MKTAVETTSGHNIERERKEYITKEVKFRESMSISRRKDNAIDYRVAWFANRRLQVSVIDDGDEGSRDNARRLSKM